MNFNETNAHPRDRYLNFDAPTHTYTLGDRILESVTTIVENCFPKFDADYWAMRKAPSMGISPEELKERWRRDADRARELGTIMHARIERYYLGDDCGDDGEAYSMFRHFAMAERLYPYRTLPLTRRARRNDHSAQPFRETGASTGRSYRRHILLSLCTTVKHIPSDS